MLKTKTPCAKYDVMSGIIAYETMNLKDAVHRTVTFNDFAQATLKRQLGQVTRRWEVTYAAK